MNGTSSVTDSPRPGQAHNKLRDKKYLRFSFDPPMYKYPYTYYTTSLSRDSQDDSSDSDNDFLGFYDE
jgi:hypothetical protein